MRYDIAASTTNMKNLANPINIAVDSVAFLVGALAWMFIVWVPVLVAVALFLRAKSPAQGSLFVFVALSSMFVLLGLFLKWIATGIIKRTFLRLAAAALVLALFGIAVESPWLTARERLNPVQRLDHAMMGVFFLFAVIILLFGLTTGVGRLDE